MMCELIAQTVIPTCVAKKACSLENLSLKKKQKVRTTL